MPRTKICHDRGCSWCHPRSKAVKLAALPWRKEAEAEIYDISDSAWEFEGKDKYYRWFPISEEEYRSGVYREETDDSEFLPEGLK